MQMYHLFSHILKIWSTSPGTAILCGDDHKSISYSKLADMIRNAESEIRLSGIRSELIVTDHEPATLIRIFACVISGCDVILIDENMPDETADARLGGIRQVMETAGVLLRRFRQVMTAAGVLLRRIRQVMETAGVLLRRVRQVMKTAGVLLRRFRQVMTVAVSLPV